MSASYEFDDFSGARGRSGINDAGPGDRQDSAARTIQRNHDAFGRLLRVEEPDAAGTLIETARYTYEVMGRLTTVQMGKRPDNTFKQTRSFAYNTKGQLTSATNPENGTVSYTYLADGLPESKTDAKGQQLWFGFGGDHRLFNVQSPLGTVKTSFTYDTNPNYATTYAQGRMTSASNDGYTWHFAYDIMGRVNKQTLAFQALDNAGQPQWWYSQAQYAYDGDGRLTDLYYPSYLAQTAQTGQRYQYSYDLLARPLGLTYETPAGSGYFYPRAQGAQYNAASQITSWQEALDTYGTSFRTLTRSYSDLRGWVTNMQAGAVLNLSYSYLANGRVSAVTDAVNPGQSVSSYEYDQFNRLTKATASNWALQWTYDEFGNRLTQSKVPGSTGTPPEITLSYNEATNRITTAGYTYDLNGNLTALPGISNITYDVFDRVVSTTVGGSTNTAKYDAFGRRVERLMPNLRRVYFYDMGGRLLAELDNPLGALPALRQIEYFVGQRLGQYTDRIGNVRYSATGSVYRHYYPFGEEITGTANNTYKFADLYRDADTGLDYAIARYHSSTIGRFLTADRHKGSFRPNMPQSLNRYSYALNDPANLSDPSGLVESAPPGCYYSNGDLMCPGDDAFSRLIGYVNDYYGSGYLPAFAPDLSALRQEALNKRLRAQAKLAVQSLDQKCKDAFDRIFGAGTVKGMEDKSGSTNYYDVTQEDVANIPLRAFGNGELGTLGKYFPPDTKAVAGVIPGPGWIPGNNIVVGETFFNEDAVGQSTALVHELLHIKTGLFDYELAEEVAAAYGIELGISARLSPSQWLAEWQLKGCEKPAPGVGGLP